MRSRHFSNLTSTSRQILMVGALTFLVGACNGPSTPMAGQSESTEATNDKPMLTYPVTVSGVSAGAYMAVQTHLALSDQISGVGSVAGGPYHCAAGSVGNALSQCMTGKDLDVTSLISFTRDKSATGAIADVENLRDDRVWIFHSPKDLVVASQVSVGLGNFYETFLPSENIRFIDDIDAAHGWPTIDVGSECLVIGGDFMNACGFDTAGALLNHLYDDLAPRDAQLGSEVLQSIDLSEYFAAGSGVADVGYAFVPNDCSELNSDCRLHISFHGCRQGAEFVEDRFALNAGLNEWAAQNQLVVVYPQIESSLMNPQGCWDWWGYTGSQYDQKGGQQISGVNALIAAFAQKRLHRLSTTRAE